MRFQERHGRFPRRGNAGVTLIELIVAVALIELAFLAIATSSRTSLMHFKRSLRETYATELAIEKMEELIARDPLSIPADSQTENVSRSNVRFLRTVEVSVGDNKSRLVTVSVVPENAELGGKCSLSNTLFVREKPAQ